MKSLTLLLLAAMLLLTGCMQSRGAATQSWSGVTPHEEFAYVGTRQGALVQLRAEDGVIQRSYTAPDTEGGGFPAFYGTPRIANDRVYMGGYEGRVYSLRASDLGDARIFEIDGSAVSKGIAGDVVPVGDVVVVAAAEGADEGRLYVLTGDTLEEVCRYPAQGLPPVGQLWTTPVVSDGVAYFTSLGHRLFAVSIEDCSLLWDAPVDLGGAAVAPPLVVNDHLYVGAFDGVFYEVDRQTGETRELFEADSWFWAPAVTDGERVYAPNLDGRVYAYDIAAGEVVWESPEGEDRPSILAGPVIVGERLVYGNDDGNLVVLNKADGSVEWSPLLGSQLRAPLSAEGNVVFAHNTDDEVFGADLDQKQWWERDLGEIND